MFGTSKSVEKNRGIFARKLISLEVNHVLNEITRQTDQSVPPQQVNRNEKTETQETVSMITFKNIIITNTCHSADMHVVVCRLKFSH